MRAARAAVVLLVAALLAWAGGAGFRSRAQLEEHFSKHGQEFGNITPAEYLRFAQELRDAPAGGPILQFVRDDGVVTRFDRRRGWFGAYNPDGTIRTLFIPVAGERYFRRQAQRRLRE
jgi:pyocin large subunit-like protein